MSAVAKLTALVGGDPVARATSKLESLKKKLSDAEQKCSSTAADIEATRASLRGAVAEDGADPGLLAGRIGKLRAEHAATEELVAVLRDAVAEAEAGLDDVKARVEREALEAELAVLEAKAPAAIAELEKLAGPMSKALSEAFAFGYAANAIRERLGLPRVPPFHVEIDASLRRLHDSLLAKHGDAHGRGVGSHTIEFPTYSPSFDAPTAKRLGIV